MSRAKKLREKSRQNRLKVLDKILKSAEMTADVGRFEIREYIHQSVFDVVKQELNDEGFEVSLIKDGPDSDGDYRAIIKWGEYNG